MSLLKSNQKRQEKGNETPECSFGVAQATPPPPPPDPSELAALVKPNADGSWPKKGGGILKRGILKGATRAAVSLGWNFEVCDVSQWVTFDNVHFYVIARNTDGTFFFDPEGSLLTSLQNQLVAACQHAGSGYFIHITDTSTLAFDSVWINYP